MAACRHLKENSKRVFLMSVILYYEVSGLVLMGHHKLRRFGSIIFSDVGMTRRVVLGRLFLWAELSWADVSLGRVVTIMSIKKSNKMTYISVKINAT